MGFKPILMEDAFWKPLYVLSQHPVSCFMLNKVPLVLVVFPIVYCIAHHCSHWKSCKILIIMDMLYALYSIKNKAQTPSQNTLK